MSPPQPYKEVQPLVIRANAGDEIRINFYNKLDRKASMHVQGLRYDVLTSDGANVGNNPDTTTRNFIQREFDEKIEKTAKICYNENNYKLKGTERRFFKWKNK